MINSIKAGITFGALLGVSHLSWAMLVALGWAQPLMGFCVLDAFHPARLCDPTIQSFCGSRSHHRYHCDRIRHRICLRCDLETGCIAIRGLSEIDYVR